MKKKKCKIDWIRKKRYVNNFYKLNVYWISSNEETASIQSIFFNSNLIYIEFLLNVHLNANDIQNVDDKFFCFQFDIEYILIVHSNAKSNEVDKFFCFQFDTEYILILNSASKATIKTKQFYKIFSQCLRWTYIKFTCSQKQKS